MNTRQLYYVIKVAEERSISVAAKKLYIAQPSLSEFIRKVEKEIGYDLFDRTVTPLRLTVAGEVYIETAKEILNLEQAMEKRLRDMDGDEYGKLSVSVSPYNGLMPSALKVFFNRFPNYTVDIHDSVGTAERLRLLEQGDVDMCIQPITDAIGSKFAVEEIMSDDLLLVVPSNHPINDQLKLESGEGPWPMVDLAQFGDMPFVVVDESMNLRRKVSNLFDKAGVVPHIQVVCYKSEGCLDMAISGIGSTIVQSSLIKYREPSHRIKCYAIKQNVIKNRVAAVWVRNRYLSKAAREFINILKTF